MKGHLRKMIVQLNDPVNYQVPLDEQLFPVSDYLGYNITLGYTGNYRAGLHGNDECVFRKGFRLRHEPCAEESALLGAGEYAIHIAVRRAVDQTS